MDDSRTLIDALLAEQSRLTVVEKFAHHHETHSVAERRYRDLIPLSLPGAGQQFAFEVDLDKCSGCKACVTACHALNGLDEGEAWREVESLVSDDWRRPFQQTVTSACHHCLDPACMNGCPVLAYEKDPITGVVRHFDDQCIGCQYCVMMCPYDVPQYSETRGIVRKCDMCSQRLAVQEAPACAQACPNEAIRITIVDQVALRQSTVAQASSPAGSSAVSARVSCFGSETLPQPAGADACATTFLAASPDPAFTLPTTRYISKAPLPGDLLSSDRSRVQEQPPHWPLVVMLVFTQLSAGAFAVLPFFILIGGTRLLARTLALIGLGALWIGLVSSVAHLGKPLKGWRSFLGLRKSWLSREVVAFGTFAPLATTLTISLWLGASDAVVGVPSVITAIVGIAGVFCSAMVYESTPRPFWQHGRTLQKFFSTMLLLGLAAGWASGNNICALFLALVTSVKLAFEHRLIRQAWHSQGDEPWPRDGNFGNWSIVQSAVLLRDRLGFVSRLRIFCGWVGGVILPLGGVLLLQGQVLMAPAFLLCLLGELAERYTFFRAVVPPKLPRRPTDE
jgi:formate dehydrogenase iron-sulfur subunit